MLGCAVLTYLQQKRPKREKHPPHVPAPHGAAWQDKAYVFNSNQAISLTGPFGESSADGIRRSWTPPIPGVSHGHSAGICVWPDGECPFMLPDVLII